MTETLVQLNVRKARARRGAPALDACPGKHPAADAKDAAESAPSPYWRSLQEYAATEEFEQILHREFPAAASEWQEAGGVSRRNFLKLMAASMALAGLNVGCDIRGPQEKIVPYVVPPELQQPAKTLMYATTMPFCGYGKGLLVQSFAGRPIKVEGNPRHPASLGATDPFAQASVLTMYDPDRSQTVLAGGEVNTWGVFLKRLRERVAAKKAAGGAGIRILTETVTSPTLADQIRQFLKQYPSARWHQYEPANRDNVTAGTVQAFGRPLNPVYHFGRAECVLSLDSNFLYEDPGSLRYARQFIDGRRLRVSAPADGGKGAAEAGHAPAAPTVWRETTLDPLDEPKPAADTEFRTNRLYVAESTPTITGAMADNRLRLPPSRIEAVAYAVASALKAPAASAAPPPLDPAVAKWVQAVAENLRQTAAARKGAALVVAGPNQPPSVHALAHAMNAVLGSVGVTVIYTEPAEAWPDPARPVDKLASLRELFDDMQRPAGDPAAVDTLLILGGNPAYAAPANLNFEEQLRLFSNRRKGGEGRDRDELVNFSAHLSLYYDETSFNCTWHIPQAHYLEAWGDVRAFNGVASVIQPLIQPLYEGRSAHDVIAVLLGGPDLTAYDAIRAYWQNHPPGLPGQASTTAPATQPAADFELAWERWLRDGLIEGTELPRVQVTLKPDLALPAPSSPGSGGLEVSFRPDPSVWDGRFANNGWLQELPKPLTKLTWDNAVYVSPATAKRLGLVIGQKDTASVVNLRYRGRRLENVPAWVWPGHPDESVTIHLGYGRTRAGRVAGLLGDTPPRGFNANALMTSDGPHFGGGLELEVTGRTAQLACTQDHQLVEGRDIARIHTVSELLGEPPLHPPDKSDNVPERGHGEGEHVSLYREYDYSKQHAWAMSIDMNACIGCNACVVACQAENNIPVVGPEQVANGREMHWIRIDTYYRGDPGLDPEAVFQPMLCQHCENAPCEVVCPVGATTHSHEGLNEMTYNRCVGTRYCSNNCPYKVRRFNFLQYQDKTTPVLKLMRNPSVTVRDRGVMEKCTYCVQRLNGARIETEKLKVHASEAATPAEREERERRIHTLMGSLQTACQQSCPTEAIVFGDMNYVDPKGRKAWVTRLKEQPVNYGVLTELNTQPRTTYLPKLINANPAIGTPATDRPGATRDPSTEAHA